MSYERRSESGGGGGAEVSDPEVAYIRSDGSDATGDGSPGAPFLTGQEAYDAGFRNFDIGAECDAGSVNVGNAVVLTVRGRGLTSEIAFEGHGNSFTVYDVGGKSVNYSARTQRLTLAAGGNVEVHGGYLKFVSAHGFDPVAMSGLGGGAAGTVTVYGPAEVLIGIEANGGTADADIENTQDGGNGGTVTLIGPVVFTSGTVLEARGAPGGGGGGSPGADGTINLRGCPVVPTTVPDTPNVAGAVINGIFYENSYP